MEPRIEPYTSEHRGAVIELSLRAWAPVFASMANLMDADVYQAFYPDSWQVSQQKSVEAVCAAQDAQVWVALAAGVPVGFIAVKHHAEDNLGEIYMLAVDPGWQGQGIGSALIAFALVQFREAGLSIALIETGRDPGHAPARRAYERAGFRAFPTVKYFKKL